MRDRVIDLISYDNAAFGYYGEPAILKNITGEIPVGHSYWITGPTGSGKSTFMRSLVGLVGIREGKISFNQQSLYEMSFEEFLPYRLRIGYGFEYGGLINNKTLKENVLLPLQYHKWVSAEEAEERVVSAFEFFDIKEHMNTRPSMVIGAVRKLVCQMRAVVMKPEILVLDDPSTGLGDDMEFQLIDFLENYLKENPLTTMVFTSRSTRFGDTFATKSIEVKDGTLYGLDPLVVDFEEENVS